MERLRHDVAWPAALRILEIFNLREEEKHEALPMVYERVKDALAAYDREMKHLFHRLRPLSN